MVYRINYQLANLRKICVITAEKELNVTEWLMNKAFERQTKPTDKKVKRKEKRIKEAVRFSNYYPFKCDIKQFSNGLHCSAEVCLLRFNSLIISFATKIRHEQKYIQSAVFT